MAKYYLRCIDCGREGHDDFAYAIRCMCGGLFEAAYPTPGKVDRYQPSIFAFHEFMPFEPTPANVALEDLDFDGEFFDGWLSEFAGVSILVKDATVFPTGTWKDLEGFVSIDRAARAGVRDLVAFSSGNTGLALARAARARGVRLHLIVPVASEPRLHSLIEAGGYGAGYLRVIYHHAGNDECAHFAVSYAERHGYAYEGGFDNIARREGLKLLGLDHCHRGLARADWYAQAVASGIGMLAFEKAYRDSGKDPIPMLGVQASACAPMVSAWNAGVAEFDWRHIPFGEIESDFVRVLRTRNPVNSYPYVYRALRRTGGAMVAAKDGAILEAIRAFCRSEYYRAVYENRGTIVGLEAATALAGVREAVRAGVVPRSATVLLNVSGAAKPGDVKRQWIDDLLPAREAA